MIKRLGWFTCMALGIVLAPAASAIELTFLPRSGAHTPATPPLPYGSVLPVQFVLDDNTQEGAFGFVSGAGAAQFLWFNRFTVPNAVLPLRLDQVWVLFPAGANMAAGNAVQVVVYQDSDSDPSNGASLLTQFNTTVQAADGTTFSIYNLATPLQLMQPGDLLIGVIPRFITTGQTSPTSPAAVDNTASAGRSWIAVWNGDPPAQPTLPPDVLITTIDALQPGGGNWMIRAFGTPLPRVPVPASQPSLLALLATALVLAGAQAMRRRQN
ncbi:MAG: hypothetical protein JNN30_14755 [Rhodanobacteraceae bacterium]|nr:hypothetical protein [Rhodanobacteraceae bacterium]